VLRLVEGNAQGQGAYQLPEPDRLPVLEKMAAFFGKLAAVFGHGMTMATGGAGCGRSEAGRRRRGESEKRDKQR
jgi:hypothetical protein